MKILKKSFLVLFLLCFSQVSRAQVTETIIGKTQNVNIAGTLSSLLSSSEKSNLKYLKLTGTIDARDVKCLRDELTVLEELDLGEVTIAAYSGIEGPAKVTNSNNAPSLFKNKNALSEDIINTDILIPSDLRNDLESETQKQKSDSENQPRQNIPSADIVYPANEMPANSFYNPETYSGKLTLKKIILPETITSLGASAFAYCGGLTSIVIPSSVTNFWSNTFYNCSGLTSFSVDVNNPVFSSLNGVLYNRNKTYLYKFPSGNNSSSFNIPSTVTNIWNSAFEHSTGLSSVTIPPSVTTIWVNSFSYCSGLTGNLTIPNSVTTIGDYAFNYCSGFTGNLTIPNSVTTIGDGAFSYCSGFTGNLTIPNSVTIIGNSAFNNCTGFNSITVDAAIPLNISSSVFYGIDKTLCLLNVPYGRKSSYQAAEVWKEFVNIIENPQGFALESYTAKILKEVGTTTVKIFGNIPWTAVSDQAWLTINPSSGNGDGIITLTSTISSQDLRTAIVTFSSNGYPTQTLNVSESLYSQATYCNAGSTVFNDEYISSINFGNINQASGFFAGGYTDYTNQYTSLQIGVETSAEITVGNPYSSDQILIWIDWNQDGDFDDVGENVYASTGTFNTPHTTSNFAPPATAKIGYTRMRIRLHYANGSGQNATPCGMSSYGEVEDYTINVIGSLNISTNTATNLTSNSATLNGTINSLGDSPVTAYGFCWNTTGTPTIADSNTNKGTTNVTGTFSDNVTGLMANTTYFVRAYTTNSSGTLYGEQITFQTNISENNTDLIDNWDGNGITGAGSNPYNFGWSNTYSNEIWKEANTSIVGTVRFLDLNSQSNPVHTYNGNIYDGRIITTRWDGDLWNSTYAKSVDKLEPNTGYILSFKYEWWNNGQQPPHTLRVGLSSTQDGTSVNSYKDFTASTTKNLLLDGNFIFKTKESELNYIVFNQINGYSVSNGAMICLADLSLMKVVNPTINTNSVSDINLNSCKANASISSLGNIPVTAYGFCWNTTGTPTIADSFTNQGSINETGAFSDDITGLNQFTTYYIRAYATNATDTIYGEQLTFKTLSNNINDYLTHQWTFDDGTAKDEIGNADGTLMEGAIIQDKALNTTSGGFLNLPANLISINTYTQLSTEIWFTPLSGANNGYSMLYYFGNTTGNYGTDYLFTSSARSDNVSRTAISCQNTSNPWTTETGVNFTEYDDGKLHHAVTVVDADSIYFYIDGVKIGSAILSASNSLANLSNAYAFLGRSGYLNDDLWKGQIHKFSIYNKALTEAEIKKQYVYDLQVKSIEAPDSVFTGQEVQIKATIINHGEPINNIDVCNKITFTNSNNSSIRKELQTKCTTISLLKDSSYQVEFNVVIPIDAYEYDQFTVSTDVLNSVPEIDESNNSLVSHNIKIARPDFQVLSIISPQQMYQGVNYQVKARIKNNGCSLVNYSTNDKIFLAKEDATQLYSLDVINAVRTIAKDSIYDLVFNITIPCDTLKTIRLIVKADANNNVLESDETNNTAVSNTVQLLYPDLQVDSIIVPDIIKSCNSIHVRARITNKGDSITDRYIYDYIYFAKDGDLQNESFGAISETYRSVAKGSSYYADFYISIPYDNFKEVKFIVKSNLYSNICESNKVNNTLVSGMKTLKYPDLRVDSIINPAVVAASEEITVRAKITNYGDSIFNQQINDYIYMANSLKSIPLTGISQTRTVPKDSSYFVEFNVKIPSDTVKYDRFVIKADDYNAVYETNETNNSKESGIIEVTRPDIEVLIITAPQELYANTNAKLSVKIRNNGSDINNLSIRNNITAVSYFDAERVISSRNRSLYCTIAKDSVATLEFDISFSPDTFRYAKIKFYADYDNEIGEKNETNNSSVSETVHILYPDLTVEKIEVPEFLYANKVFTVKAKITNIGDNISSRFNYCGLYMSDNANPENLTELNIDYQNRTLLKDSSYWAIFNVNLPSATIENKSLVIVADYNNYIVEWNENNNAKKTEAIKFLYPDLEVKEIILPQEIVTGENIIVSAIIKNNGDNINNFTWTDKIGYAKGADLQNIIPLNQLSTSVMLLKEDTYKVDFTVKLPVDTARYIRFVISADDTDLITESIETNNSLATNVLKLHYSDLEVKEIILPQEIVAGEDMVISAIIKNNGDKIVNKTWTDKIGYIKSADLQNIIPLNQLSTSVTLLKEDTYKVDFTVKLPVDTARFIRFAVITDISNNVFEANENNNTLVTNVVKIAYSDLEVKEIILPQEIVAGEDMVISAIIKNNGDKINNKSWTDKIGYIKGADLQNIIPLNQLSKSVTLLKDETYKVDFTVKLPVDTTRYIRFAVVTDISNNVFEANENNNTLVTNVVKISYPDLQIETIVMPDELYSGEEITFKVKVVNKFVKTATFNSVDKLFISRNSLPEKTLLVGQVSKNRTLQKDSSYVVEYKFRLPADSVKYNRFKVTVDVNNSLQEDNEDNNVREIVANIQYPKIDAYEFKILSSFNQSTSGVNWTNTWDISNSEIYDGRWYGLTFNRGHVTSITLPANGINGALPYGLFTFAELKTINLSGNKLTGKLNVCADSIKLSLRNAENLTSIDLSNNLLSGELSEFASQFNKLSNLNVSANQLSEIKNPLSTQISVLNLRNQTIDVEPSSLSVTPVLNLPTLMTYNHSSRTYTEKPAFSLLIDDSNIGNLKYQWGTYNLTWNNSAGWVYKSGRPLVLRQDNSFASGSTATFSFLFENGDANVDNLVNVLDVQHELNYAFDENPKPFNYYAADMFRDSTINVQDIVLTVNKILSDTTNNSKKINQYARVNAFSSENTLMINNNKIILYADVSVSAMDISVKNTKSNQIKLLLNNSDFQMKSVERNGDVRFIIFSPNGTSLPRGMNELVEIQAASPELENVILADRSASYVPAKISGSVSGLFNGGIYELKAFASENNLFYALPAYTRNLKITLYDVKGMVIRTDNFKDQLSGLYKHTYSDYLVKGVYLIKLDAEIENSYATKTIRFIISK